MPFGSQSVKLALVLSTIVATEGSWTIALPLVAVAQNQTLPLSKNNDARRQANQRFTVGN
jgi:hypothetical protein